MNFFKNNIWVGYSERDYLVMKQAIIAKMQNPVTGIPEITDHNESNPFIKRLSIWCGINEQLGYYVDNKGREAFLMTARIYRSVINIARGYDYRVRGVIPATGQVKFISSDPVVSNYTIPKGTVVTTAEGIEFETLADAIIVTGDTEVIVDVKQWTKATPISITSNGQLSQTQILEQQVADGSVTILVNGLNQYNPIDSFVLAKNTDEVFLAQMNFDGNMEVVFGDGVNGIIPPNGQTIDINYYTSLGTVGNVGVSTITEIKTNITPPIGSQLSVTNLLPTTNGTDAEGLNELKKLIPLSLRTLYRAVTEQDYIDVAELAPGVAKAGVSYSCGKFVDIYIVPNGGGIASPTLLNSTLAYMEDRVSITTFPRLNAAGQVIIEYLVQVKALPNYFNSVVEANVIQSMQDFHSIDNQKISGKVFIGDIYQAIENTTGVDNSQVIMMRPLPYARPLLPTFPVLDWTRQQTSNATNNTYKLVFISSTQFKIVKGSVYVGTYNIGVLVSLPDIEFTINAGAYVIGNAYEFKTYVSAGSVILDEPSLPTFDLNYFTITVTGGL